MEAGWEGKIICSRFLYLPGKKQQISDQETSAVGIGWSGLLVRFYPDCSPKCSGQHTDGDPGTQSFELPSQHLWMPARVSASGVGASRHKPCWRLALIGTCALAHTRLAADSGRTLNSCVLQLTMVAPTRTLPPFGVLGLVLASPKFVRPKAEL